MGLSGFDENVEKKKGQEGERRDREKMVLVDMANVKIKVVEKAI